MSIYFNDMAWHHVPQHNSMSIEFTHPTGPSQSQPRARRVAVTVLSYAKVIVNLTDIHMHGMEVVS